MKKMKIQNKIRIAIVTTLIISLLFGVWLGRFVYPAYIEDVTEAWITQPLQEASYLIGEYNSTHYYARNATGYGTSINKGYEALSSNATSIINNALGNLTTGRTWYEKVVCYGNFTLTGGTIKVWNWTEFELIGTMTRGATHDAVMIENYDYSLNFGKSNCIQIHGGRWIGNHGAQSAGTGDSKAVLHVGNASESRLIDVYDMAIVDSSGHGVWFERIANSMIHDLYVRLEEGGSGVSGTGGGREATSACIRTHGLSDTKFYNIHMAQGGATAGAFWSTGGVISCSFDDIDCGGSNEFGWLIDATPCQRNWWSNIQMDSVSRHMFYVNGTTRFVNNTIIGLHCTRGSMEVTNTYDMIHIDMAGAGVATNNTFIGGGFWDKGTEKVRYGIYEGNGADYNSYSGFNFAGVGTAGFVDAFLGNNSKIADCWNGTSYIISYTNNERHGTTIDLANGAEIAHGLGGVPTCHLLTSCNATYDNVVLTVSVNHLKTNATHLVLYIYWNNGTAITDNVIDVSWLVYYDP